MLHIYDNQIFEHNLNQFDLQCVGSIVGQITNKPYPEIATLLLGLIQFHSYGYEMNQQV